MLQCLHFIENASSLYPIIDYLLDKIIFSIIIRYFFKSIDLNVFTPRLLIASMLQFFNYLLLMYF